MSFSLSWIMPRLAVGSAPENVSDARRLASLGVTDVLDVRLKPMDFAVDTTNADAIYAGTGIRYHNTPMRDNGAQKTPAQYADAVTFARDVLAKRGTKLFVHCAAGQYRSPGVIYAILRALGYSGFPGFDAAGAPIGQSDAWSLITNVRTVYPQYLRGAEASVPSLPRVVLGDAVEPSANWVPWAAAAVGVGVFLALRNGANPLAVAFALPFIPP